MSPDEYENKLPPHPDPLPRRGEGKKNKKFRVPSPLMGEVEDEGGFLNCSRFTLHSSQYFQDRPSCCLCSTT